MSRRFVRSIVAAEVFATAGAIFEGKFLKTALSTLLVVYIKLVIVIDSEDLHTFLSTPCISIDNSICTDINVLRFEYEVGHVNVMC